MNNPQYELLLITAREVAVLNPGNLLLQEKIKECETEITPAPWWFRVMFVVFAVLLLSSWVGMMIGLIHGGHHGDQSW